MNTKIVYNRRYRAGDAAVILSKLDGLAKFLESQKASAQNSSPGAGPTPRQMIEDVWLINAQAQGHSLGYARTVLAARQRWLDTPHYTPCWPGGCQ